MTAVWYLARGVAWTVPLGFLGAAATMVAMAHRWESTSGLALPLCVLLATTGAAFVYDDPAVAVTAVTPRGGWWSGASRLVGAAALVAAGLAVLTLAPGSPDVAAWGLVTAGLAAVVVAAALVGRRRLVPAPGASIASAVLLAGLSPLVLGLLLDLPSPYPAPSLPDAAGLFWCVCAGAGASASLVLLRGSAR